MSDNMSTQRDEGGIYVVRFYAGPERGTRFSITNRSLISNCKIDFDPIEADIAARLLSLLTKREPCNGNHPYLVRD